MVRAALVVAAALAAVAAQEDLPATGPSFVVSGDAAYLAGVRGAGGAAYNRAPIGPAALREGALAADPAVAVFVVVPDASGAGVSAAAARGDLAALGTLVDAKPSATLPHVDASYAGIHPAYFGEAGAEGAVPLREAAAAVASRAPPRAGGRALRLTAVAPSLADVEKHVGALHAAMAEAAGEAYVLVVAATAPPARGARGGLSPLRRLAAAATAAKAGVRMTPDILTGILVGGLFVFVALLGLTCINSIQTPSQFADHGPPSAKEF